MTTWTPDIVMVRLIEAYTVIERTTTRPRPRRFGNAMPASKMFETDQDAFEFERIDLTLEGGRAMSQIKADRREEIIRLAQKGVPAETISMAFEAQRWPIDVIDHEEKRECLIAYATCRARGKDWTKALRARNERVAKEKRWLRLKTYRWNEQSCQRISDRLTKDSVLLRLPMDLQMIQPEAKHACEIAKVVPHAWMAPDAKPRHLPEMLDQTRV